MATTLKMSDEQIKVEQFKINNFLRLGYSIYEATCAVDMGIDWHDVEDFLNKQPTCSRTMALKIVR